VLAYGIYLRYQATDATTTGTSAMATATTASDSSGRSGLSTGATVGIGVGVGVVGLAIIAAVDYLLCSRRRRKIDSPEDQEPHYEAHKPHYEAQKPQDGMNSTTLTNPAELDGDNSSTLNRPAEADGGVDHQVLNPYKDVMSPKSSILTAATTSPEPELVELPASNYDSNKDLHEAPGESVGAVERHTATSQPAICGTWPRYVN
jgi:hypothetical protein